MTYTDLYHVITYGASHGIMGDKGEEFFSFSFDFKSRSIYCGNLALMVKGEVVPQMIEFLDGETARIEPGMELLKEEWSIERAEALFFDFYKARPSKNAPKSHFKAAKENQLSLDSLIGAKSQIEANTRLEGYILLGAVTKKAHIPFKGYFWRSERYPEFLIYKEWVS